MASSIPPDEDSPQNIVNIMNDDCLQVILLKLDDVLDFYHAAIVCTRFQHNAKMCYRHKVVEFIHGSPWWRDKHKNIKVPFEYAESFLQLFGAKIISCEARNTSNIQSPSRNRDISLIAKYCSNSLIKLKIWTGQCNLHIETPFKVLRELTLYSCSISSNDIQSKFPELTYLKLHNPSEVDSNWLSNHFPKLRSFAYYDNGLMNRNLLRFHLKNQQIRSFKAYTHFEDNAPSSSSSTSPWRSIEHRLPNLEIVEGNFDCEDVKYIRKLPLLNNIKYIQEDLESIMTLLKFLYESNHPIEELTLKSIYQLFSVLHIIRQGLYTMRKLTFCNDQIFPSEFILILIRGLPTLECFSVRHVKMKTVIQILEMAGPVFRKLVIQGKTAQDLDLNAYHSIESLATNRVKVNIQLKDFSLLDQNVLEMRSEWLTISKYRDKDD